jgi:hypothetical protein
MPFDLAEAIQRLAPTTAPDAIAAILNEFKNNGEPATTTAPSDTEGITGTTPADTKADETDTGSPTGAPETDTTELSDEAKLAIGEVTHSVRSVIEERNLMDETQKQKIIADAIAAEKKSAEDTARFNKLMAQDASALTVEDRQWLANEIRQFHLSNPLG